MPRVRVCRRTGVWIDERRPAVGRDGGGVGRGESERTGHRDRSAALEAAHRGTATASATATALRCTSAAAEEWTGVGGRGGGEDGSGRVESEAECRQRQRQRAAAAETTRGHRSEEAAQRVARTR